VAVWITLPVIIAAGYDGRAVKEVIAQIHVRIDAAINDCDDDAFARGNLVGLGDSQRPDVPLIVANSVRLGGPSEQDGGGRYQEHGASRRNLADLHLVESNRRPRVDAVLDGGEYHRRHPLLCLPRVVRIPMQCVVRFIAMT
jgi:hypothetical protein